VLHLDASGDVVESGGVRLYLNIDDPGQTRVVTTAHAPLSA
jgi:hypothetical protein